MADLSIKHWKSSGKIGLRVELGGERTDYLLGPKRAKKLVRRLRAAAKRKGLSVQLRSRYRPAVLTPEPNGRTAVVYRGDCLEVLQQLPDHCIDSVICDPPYHLTSGKKGGSGQASLNPNSPAGRSRICTGGFMGKHWDGGDVAFRPETWRAVLRVVKPGGYLLAFGGTRTWHRLACAIEDAGWELKDNLAYLYGSGFPKSLNIGKAVDKLQGCDLVKEQEIAHYLQARRKALGLSRTTVDKKVFSGSTRYSFVEGRNDKTGGGRIYLPTPLEWKKLKRVLKLDDRYDTYIAQAIPERENRARVDGGKGVELSRKVGDFGYQDGERWNGEQRVTTPKSAEAKRWIGYGSALKPSFEPIILAMAPLDGTYAANALTHGVAGLNIDGCRVGFSSARDENESKTKNQHERFNSGKRVNKVYGADNADRRNYNPPGRWPPNTVLCHLPGCTRVGTKRVKGGGGLTSGKSALGQGSGWNKHNNRPTSITRPVDSDNKETVEAWACAPGCVVAALDRQSGITTNTRHMSYKRKGSTIGCVPKDQPERDSFTVETGGASRFFPCLSDPPFFYTAKAGRKERTAGGAVTNNHPTVKPLSLLRYLCKLTATPTGGTVLDPFMGSGSTGVAALLEGRDFIGIELERASYRTSKQRIKQLRYYRASSMPKKQAKLKKTPRRLKPLFNRGEKS